MADRRGSRRGSDQAKRVKDISDEAACGRAASGRAEAACRCWRRSGRSGFIDHQGAARVRMPKSSFTEELVSPEISIARAASVARCRSAARVESQGIGQKAINK